MAKHIQIKPVGNELRFSVGSSSVFRFWMTGDDAYISVRQFTSDSKISMHKTGVTLVNLGKQRKRFRLKNRVNVGRGWDLALQMTFPSIRLDELEKPPWVIPKDCQFIEGGAVGRNKYLSIYVSYEPVDPPHFKRQEHFGPFIKRDSGAYWIYFSEGALLPYEEKLIKTQI